MLIPCFAPINVEFMKSAMRFSLVVWKQISWTCSSRVEVVDKPLLAKMKKAGCWRTRFGIESGHDEVLDFISKGITQEKIKVRSLQPMKLGCDPKHFSWLATCLILEKVFWKPFVLLSLSLSMILLCKSIHYCLRHPNSIFGTKKVISGGALSVQQK